MPADYEAVRDSIYQKLLKKGWTSKRALREAKKRAAIWWYKKHPGKKFTHSDANIFSPEELRHAQFIAAQMLVIEEKGEPLPAAYDDLKVEE